jgi:protein NirF
MKYASLFFLLVQLTGCASQNLRGTGDLGVVVERASGKVQIVETTQRTVLDEIDGLGNLAHATVAFSRDQRYAYVFGRDGGLTKVDILTHKIVKRIIQSGDSIGGALSTDGTLIGVANYEPGGVRFFRSDNLEPVAEIPAIGKDGKRSKVVGLVGGNDNLFAFSLFESGEIWLADMRDPAHPKVTKFTDAGREPYDALITPDGRWYLAGLFGEDGMTLLDLWHPERGLKHVLADYGKGSETLPVYKMPHLEGWGFYDHYAFVPGVGHHEVLVVDMNTWTVSDHIPTAGQPVFVVGRPASRQIWVNFAFPNNPYLQVIDAPERKVIKTLEPGKGVMFLEFTPRGENVWVSARDSDKLVVYDTATFEKLAELHSERPSGIFFTPRANHIGW